MQLIFLGTSSMVPTRERNHSAVFFDTGREGMLFDCGEGTQRQLKIADIRPTRVGRVFLTHWHGDHALGLMGLLQTLAQMKHEQIVYIYGPRGTSARLRLLCDIYGRPDIPIEIKEQEKGVVLDTGNFTITALPLDHTSPCIGYRFEEKSFRKMDMEKAKRTGLREGRLIGQLQRGKTVMFKGKEVGPEDVSFIRPGKIIALCTDTQPCRNAMLLAKDADIFICEATFGSDLTDKGEAYGHMTSQQAAQLAQQAKAKKLILTHFSQRYKSVDELVEEAKVHFKDTVAAHDFLKVKV